MGIIEGLVVWWGLFTVGFTVVLLVMIGLNLAWKAVREDATALGGWISTLWRRFTAA